MIDLTHPPCPICAQTSSEVLYRMTYPEYRYAGTFILRRCSGCGLLFNSPRLDDGELEKLYSKNYYFFSRAAASEFKRIAGMYFRTIGQIDGTLLRTKRLIDIGCGRGYFPAVLNGLGWDAHGVEISPDASQFARDYFDLNVFNGTVEQFLSTSKGQFSIVTAIDVIEHVSDPDEFIRAAANIVESGGWLIIDTPNAAAANIAADGIFWKGFNPFHIYLFSIKNLTMLLSRYGLTVEQSFSYNNSSSSGMRREIISSMKKTGLSAMIARMYFGSKRWMTVFDGSLPLLAKRAASEIKRKSSSKRLVDDGPFAATKTGDNFVVIARRH
jgi:2-polyprenyl-3-methyl-5-hydroxy-6-metoxy-1,4-benzoquinol methylase